MTHEADWDPEVLDNELTNDQDWYDSLLDMPLLFPLFDEQGALHPNVMAQWHYIHSMSQEDEPSPPPILIDIGANDMTVHNEDPDVNKSADRCVYYANLHCMVPFEQLEMDTDTIPEQEGLQSTLAPICMAPCQHH